MTLALFILCSVCIANLILGFIVYTRNSSNSINRSYLYFVSSISAWTIFNYLTDNVHSILLSLWSARFANFFGLLSVYSFWYFCSLFTHRPSKNKFYLASTLLTTSLLISLSPLGIKDIRSIHVAADQVIGELYWFIALALVAGFVGLAIDLIKGFKASRDHLLKTNIKLILVGTTITFIFAVATNVVLPLAFSSWNISRLGPIFTLILAAFVAFGIIRHRLFDIRPIVARALAYVLSLLFIGLLYTGVVFGLVNRVFGNTSLEIGQQIFYVAFAVLSALIFQPVKKEFDKITNSIFFRDAYEPQAFVNELNSALVRNIEMENLLKAAAKVINKYLKSEFAVFAILGENQQPILYGSHHLQIEPGELAWLHEVIHPASTKVLITSDLSSGNNKMLPVLQKSSVAAVISLASHKASIGYLFLGDKKSGNIFSKQDRQMMEIVGQELAIATENALRFEEIQKFNITLQDKVDEATKKLRHANVRLKELDATKDEFISMASHQLRTPLTTIKGYLSMILDGDVGKVKAEEKDLIQHAFDSAERMVYLIADLLNVSRLQTGKFVIENKPTNLAQVLEGEITQLKEQAATRKIMLAYEKPKEFPLLNLDETKIRQVMMNFLDNGLYYTPSGGEVTAKLEATPDSVNFTVTDTGVGVPVSVQHHLFTKFYRADNARKMRPDGTGLGLYMAKKVIVAQGGAVIFKSTEGKGSTFGFSFPRKEMEAKA
jgi:signal transduction histidine kinase